MQSHLARAPGPTSPAWRFAAPYPLACDPVPIRPRCRPPCRPIRRRPSQGASGVEGAELEPLVGVEPAVHSTGAMDQGFIEPEIESPSMRTRSGAVQLSRGASTWDEG